jgi:hypothetical protein
MKPKSATPFARYTARVITRTSDSRFGAFPLSPGLSALAACFRSSVRAVELNAIVPPSGDQSGLPAPRGMAVTARASPPVIDKT